MSPFADLLSPSATGAKAGGARRDRTDDLMLAKHALYQLSYGPRLRCGFGAARPHFNGQQLTEPKRRKRDGW